MKFKIIKSEEEYETALRRLEKIFHAPAKSKEGEEAELLMLLIEKYEEKYVPMDKKLDPIDAIKFRMDQLGIDKKELTNVLGHQSRVSEILNKKRQLSLQMIKALHRELKIPYELLMSA